MKRSAPLRRTALARGTSQLRRTEMRRQRKPLAYRSKKTAELYRLERTPLNRELAEQPRRCEFPLGCDRIAESWHEYHSRGQGGSYVDRANLRASCVQHNCWAEDHINEAHDIGWRYCKKRQAQLAIEGEAA